MSLRCLTFGKAREKIHRTTATICLYEDATELIDDPQTEAVAIATPAAIHFSFARRAILRDKHGLVERPMCASLPDAKELAGSDCSDVTAFSTPPLLRRVPLNIAQVITSAQFVGGGAASLVLDEPISPRAQGRDRLHRARHRPGRPDRQHLRAE
jgi:hypothetical protein